MKSRRSAFWFRTALITAISAAAVVNAQVNSFNFRGIVDRVSNYPASDPRHLPDDITPGLPVLGTITYSLEHLSDEEPGDSKSGVYVFSGATASDFSMTVTVGSHTFSSGPSRNAIFVSDNTSDVLSYVSSSVLRLDGSPLTQYDLEAMLRLVDSTHTALSSDAFPNTIPELSRFDISEFLLNDWFYAEGWFPEQNFVGFHSTIASITPVPHGTITRSADGTLTVVSTGTAGTVESTDHLLTPNWTAIGAAPQMITPTGTAKFYRIRAP